MKILMILSFITLILSFIYFCVTAHKFCESDNPKDKKHYRRLCALMLIFTVVFSVASVTDSEITERKLSREAVAGINTVYLE